MAHDSVAGEGKGESIGGLLGRWPLGTLTRSQQDSRNGAKRAKQLSGEEKREVCPFLLPFQ